METPIEIESNPVVTKLYNFDGSLLAILGPAAVSMLDATEIKQRVNKYDDLIKQRDALAAACEELTLFAEQIVHFYKQSILDFGYIVFDENATCEIITESRAALALVKGDQKSDDATA